MEHNFNRLATPIAVGGNHPLDAALSPVESYDQLTAISEEFRYEGMTVTVKDDNIGSMEYFFYSEAWKIKKLPVLRTFADMSLLPTDYRQYLIGTEVVIRKDENNDNKPTKYWVSAITRTGVTWERRDISSDENIIAISGNDMEESEAVPAE